MNCKSEELLAAIGRRDHVRVKDLLTSSQPSITLNSGGTSPYQQPLGVALSYRDINIFKILLEVGAYPHGTFLDDALEIAMYDGRVDFLKALIDANVEVNYLMEEGETVLMRAVRAGNLDIVKLLVESGADVNITSQNNDFALLFAKRKGYENIVSYLFPLTLLSLRNVEP